MTNLIEKAHKFPPLKQSAQLALAKLDDAESPIEDIAKIIVTDTSLTSSILKLANSPLYGFSRTVSSIVEACILLGRFSLRNLVLSMSVYNQVMSHGSNILDRAAIWQQSMMTGCVAKRLCLSGKKDADVLLTSGILHQFGKLILAWADESRYQQVLDYQTKFDEVDYKAEQSLLNHNHAEVGAEILASWNVPEKIVHTIARYPEQFDTPKDVLSATLALAKLLVENDERSQMSNGDKAKLTAFLAISEQHIAKALETAKLDLQQLTINSV